MKFLLSLVVLFVPTFGLAQQCQSNAPPQSQISALDLQLLQRNTPVPFNANPAEPSADMIQRAVDRALEQMLQKQDGVPADNLSSAIRGAVRQRVNRNVQTNNQAPPQPCPNGACELDSLAEVDDTVKARTKVSRTSFAAFKLRYSEKDKYVRN